MMTNRDVLDFIKRYSSSLKLFASQTRLYPSSRLLDQSVKRLCKSTSRTGCIVILCCYRCFNKYS